MEIERTHCKRFREEDYKFTSNKKGRFEKTPETNCIDALPEELLLQILTNLSECDEFIIPPLVCRTWKRISDDEHLWSEWYFKIFGKQTDLFCEKPSKLQFKEAIELEKKIAAHFPQLIINAFGGARAIVSLPILLTEKNLISLFHYCMSVECKSPLTLLIFDDGSTGLMIRYANSKNPLNKICTFLLFFDDNPCPGWRFESFKLFDKCLGHYYSGVFNRLIYKGHRPPYTNYYRHLDFLEDYFTRLIRRQPCGDISGYGAEAEEIDPSIEGACRIYLA